MIFKGINICLFTLCIFKNLFLFLRRPFSNVIFSNKILCSKKCIPDIFFRTQFIILQICILFKSLAVEEVPRYFKTNFMCTKFFRDYNFKSCIIRKNFRDFFFFNCKQLGWITRHLDN